jgi:hypothetical protein
MQKVYLITFNQPTILEFFDFAKFHSQLLSYPYVTDWWHYLKTTYIIITNPFVTASDVTKHLLPLMKQINFLVIEVNLQNHNGLLHPDAWKWINSRLDPTYNLGPIN